MHRRLLQEAGQRGLEVFSLLLVLAAWPGQAAALPGVPFTGTVLTAPDRHANADFGSAVVISEDGNMVMVGAPSGAPCPGISEPACGAVYVYTRSATGWSLETTLTPADGGAKGFGFALALSPDSTVALVGGAKGSCPEEWGPQSSCGLLYVFTRDAGGWTQEARIVDPLVSAGYEYGISLALSEAGEIALVAGSPFSCAASGSYCKHVHTLSRDGGAWTLGPGFIPDFNAITTPALALSRDGSKALVGIWDSTGCASTGTDCGAVFAYSQQAGVWSQTGKLSGSKGLGYSLGVAGDGEVAVVGNPLRICSGRPTACPEGLLLRRSGNDWLQEAGFSVDPRYDYFAARVALSANGETALLLAQSRDCSDCADIFVSQHHEWGWSPPRHLAPSFPGVMAPRPIQPLAISGDGETKVVGAPLTSCAAGESCGAVYVFEGIPEGPVAPTPIPALGGPGLILLAFLLAGGGAILLRRRRAVGP